MDQEGENDSGNKIQVDDEIVKIHTCPLGELEEARILSDTVCVVKLAPVESTKVRVECNWIDPSDRRAREKLNLLARRTLVGSLVEQGCTVVSGHGSSSVLWKVLHASQIWVMSAYATCRYVPRSHQMHPW